MDELEEVILSSFPITHEKLRLEVTKLTTYRRSVRMLRLEA